jgi:hypothetical protein
VSDPLRPNRIKRRRRRTRRLQLALALTFAAYAFSFSFLWPSIADEARAVAGTVVVLALVSDGSVLPSLRLRQILLQLGLIDSETSDDEAAITYERDQLSAEVSALRQQAKERHAAVSQMQHEADRLAKIIEAYRSQASSEFQQAATDLLGEESAASVASHYREWADELHQRHRTARLWSIIVVVVGSVAITGLLLYGTAHQFNGQLLAAKISIGIPVAVLYTLLYRESAQYRREGLLAANISVQMRSIAAYTIWLDKESKDAVRRKLGEALFVGPPSHLLETSGSSDQSLPNDVVMELLRSALGVRQTQAR